MENSLEVAAVQTIVVRKMKEAPVPRTSVGKISLMMIYIIERKSIKQRIGGHFLSYSDGDVGIMKNII